VVLCSGFCCVVWGTSCGRFSVLVRTPVGVKGHALVVALKNGEVGLRPASIGVLLELCEAVHVGMSAAGAVRFGERCLLPRQLLRAHRRSWPAQSSYALLEVSCSLRSAHMQHRVRGATAGRKGTFPVPGGAHGDMSLACTVTIRQLFGIFGKLLVTTHLALVCATLMPSGMAPRHPVCLGVHFAWQGVASSRDACVVPTACVPGPCACKVLRCVARRAGCRMC
jgi:hypothetical protein